MQKSVSARIKVTGSGKLRRKSMAQDHFRINKTGKQIRQKRNPTGLKGQHIKMFKKYLAKNH